MPRPFAAGASATAAVSVRVWLDVLASSTSSAANGLSLANWVRARGLRLTTAAFTAVAIAVASAATADAAVGGRAVCLAGRGACGAAPLAAGRGGAGGAASSPGRAALSPASASAAASSQRSSFTQVRFLADAAAVGAAAVGAAAAGAAAVGARGAPAIGLSAPSKRTFALASTKLGNALAPVGSPAAECVVVVADGPSTRELEAVEMGAPTYDGATAVTGATRAEDEVNGTPPAAAPVPASWTVSSRLLCAAASARSRAARPSSLRATSASRAASSAA